MDERSPTPLEFDPSHELLTISQFAARLQRSKMTIYKWIATGRMPPGTVVDVQGCYRVDWTQFAKIGIRIRS